jgi:Glycoside hydrolase family 44
LFSGYNQQYGSINGWGFLPDRANHGGADYLPWLLDQLRQNHAVTGRRVLDIFTVHYYPQSGEFSEDVSTAMQQRRNRSTRSSVGSNVRRSIVDQRSPAADSALEELGELVLPGHRDRHHGVQLGAENHINGATTQADIYGIFGREGLDMGARWTTPATSTPTYKAMKMYRNYDDNKSTFGDISVAATLPNPDVVSAFAAERSSDRALTVIVINEDAAATTATINVVNVTHRGSSQVWQLTSANALTRLADVALAGNSLTATLPAQSITLFIVPAGAATPAPTAPNNLRTVR